MPRHRRYLYPLALALCSLVASAGVALAMTTSEPPAVVSSPEPAALPAWLMPAPDPSLPDLSGIPSFAFRTCSTSCYNSFKVCKARCGGDQDCISGCSDNFQCCIGFCGGTGCP
jgi:hypothetical protein